MKKQSRLAVLLAAVLAFVTLFTGVAFATATELNSNLSDVEAALSAEEVQAELVYQQLMECTTLESVFGTMMLEENRTGMYALNGEQLNGLNQYVRSMYGAISDPTEDETYYFNDIVETLTVIADGNGVILQPVTVLADTNITLDLSNGSITITPSGFTAKDANGGVITGSATDVTVTTSSATANSITLSGNSLKCNLTLKDVQRTGGGIGLRYDKDEGANSDVTILLSGSNKIGQLYYTGNSKLKITSASGDGSTDGTLIVTAAASWSAAIGGEDADESFGNLTIAGGTIIATATNGAAIGGAGNGNATIAIAGGNITASNSGTSAAIGGGGGQSGTGGVGNVIITGGIVTATNSGVGVAIGGGGSESNTVVGEANVQLLGGTISATASQRYAISGGYSGVNSKYAATNITIGADVTYSGTINTNATITRQALIFDLAKANVVFDENGYEGLDMAGNLIKGTHVETNRYIVRQSTTTATSNSIKLGEEIAISGSVHLEIDGINSSATNSISIPASQGKVKDVVLYLKGTNKVNNILYYTIAGETSTKGQQTNSTLKITSAAGDGSTDGSLIVIPAKGNGKEDGSVHYNAAIGGTDSLSGVTGLHIAGGTITVRVDESNDCSAIGGGGNGYAEILISGGNIDAQNASTGATIGGGVGYTAPGSGCDITITGGTVTAENKGKYKTNYIDTNAWCYGVAIGGGSTYKVEADSDASNVTITGGNVTAIVSEGQTAIGAGNSCLSDAGDANVTIIGGTVTCQGGVGGGSTIEGNGGNGTLTVSGGNVSVKGFIGGGSTQNGTAGGTATVDISGAGTVVKAGSIGGGIAETTKTAAKANVTISNGQVQAQVVMEGEGSTFNMTGGTVDNSNAASEGYTFKMADGGAVYIAKGEATMTGGTIQNCSTNDNGGAIYITGGSFSLSGDGKISDCEASYGGGAAYVSSGSFSMDGGAIEKCEAMYGGAAYVTGGDFIMTGGTLDGNTAVTDGGAVYVTNGNVSIGTQNCSMDTHPVLQNNSAVNGGAIAVAGSTPVMYCGTMKNNTASQNGGAVYVSGGGFTMNNGTMSNNSASTSGGAAYVSGGNFTMYGGTLGGSNAGNTAKNGGAVYVTGGNFTMISGEMSYNEAVASSNAAAEAGTEGQGGAVYAAASGGTGGAVVVGVKDCTGVNEGTEHSVTYTNLTHPVVKNNVAKFGGGFLVNGGSVAFYCGSVNGNKTDSDGTGMNVFMKDGTIVHYLNETAIGSEQDHGMVSTGGKLTVHFEEEGTNKHFTVELIYNSNYGEGTNFDILWKGEAPEGYYLNLPYCPTEWQNHQLEKPEKYRFVGWTDTYIDVNSKTIRSTKDYNPIGTPVEIRDMTEDDDDKIMRFYAVWAPQTSAIHYACVTDGKTVNSNWDYDGPISYDYTRSKVDVKIGEPNIPGYTFQKWILYAEYGTDFTVSGVKTINIANWGSDAECVKDEPPTYIPTLYSQIDADTLISSVSEKLTNDTLTTLENFGDITLVAVFKPAYTDLTITKSGTINELDNPSFIFHVAATDLLDGNLEESDYNMYVVIDGTGSVTIQDLPVGTYTVTEQDDWSWRYSAGENEEQSVTLSDPTKTETLTFTNTRQKTKWLDGETIETNVFY